MRRLRRTVNRLARLAGPTLGIAFVVFIGGLGLHAARDWHRHGELGAGFFHLHFHVGEHGHDHPTHDGHDHDTPTDGKQRRTAVLTVAHALDDFASAAPAIASLQSTPHRTPIESVFLPRLTESSTSANPRAPPP